MEPQPDFKLPKYWPRVWSIDVDRTNASVLWAAHNREADTLYIYAELVTPRYELALVADAIKQRNRAFGDMPGLFDHLARGRSQQEGQRIIDALLDLRLEIFTSSVDADAGAAEVTRRLSTKRLKVFATCERLRAQMNSYRRNKDGDIVAESDGLIRAMDLLCMEAPRYAALDEQSELDAKQDWAGQTRSSVTGY